MTYNLIIGSERRGTVIKIVTDSSCDLPIDTLKEFEIPFAPLNIFVEDQTFKEDIDITPEEFWQSMSKSHELPKTSQPSPADFAGIFEEIQKKGDTPLCITISSKLSGTYQSAVLGAEMTGSKAIVFDSLAGSISHGIQVLIAARMAKSGATVEDVLSALRIYRDNVKIIIPLATVENIVKGGRLSKFQGSVVNILNMKIILHGVNGEVKLLKKVRGNKRFRATIIELIEESAKTGKKIFGITHVNNLEDAKFFSSEIRKRVPDSEVIIGKMGPAIATYAGEGGLILAL